MNGLEAFQTLKRIETSMGTFSDLDEDKWFGKFYQSNSVSVINLIINPPTPRMPRGKKAYGRSV